MGKKMGLSPLETLAAIYVGLQLFGLFGFLLGPIGLLIIKDFCGGIWGSGRRSGCSLSRRF